MSPVARADAGFSYVEIMVAVLLLALCAVPAAEAVRNGLAASSVARTQSRELRCMKTMMETVLAEPYRQLSNAAVGMATPSSYSRPGDGACPTRNVYVSRYELANGASTGIFLPDARYPRTPEQLDTALLYVTVSSPETAYTFTTLVAR